MGNIPGSTYGISDDGWMNGELLTCGSITISFATYVPSTRPLLLLLDGLSSHCNPTTVRKAAEDGVILFTATHHSPFAASR